MLATTHRVPVVPTGRRILLEARISWDGEVIAVTHVRAGSEVRLQALVSGEANVVVGRSFADGFGLVLPTGAPVPAGKGMTLRSGRRRIELAIVEDDSPAELAERPSFDRRVLYGFAAACAVHIAVVVGALTSGPSSADIEASSERELTGYLAAAEMRAETEALATETATSDVENPAFVTMARESVSTASNDVARAIAAAFV